MQAYKENRLAQGGYFSATVAGSSLVAKSHGMEPLSAAEATLEATKRAAAAAGRVGMAGAERVRPKSAAAVAGASSRHGRLLNRLLHRST